MPWWVRDVVPACQKERPRMATMTTTTRTTSRTDPDAQTAARRSPVPRALRAKVEPLLLESYAFMDSPVFKQKNIERELFDYVEPALPLTSWYQPTRDEAIDETMAHAPQLMKGNEEKLMFLRFNFAKRRLTRLQAKIAKEGLPREPGE